MTTEYCESNREKKYDFEKNYKKKKKKQLGFDIVAHNRSMKSIVAKANTEIGRDEPRAEQVKEILKDVTMKFYGKQKKKKIIEF